MLICLSLQLQFIKRKILFKGGPLMAFRRRSSKVITDALARLANLKAIDPNLDLGNNLNVATYEAQINKTQQSQNTYNGILAQADAAGNDFNADERELRDMSSQVLSAVKVKYGRDSNEYEMAGGKRLSEINRHPNKGGNKPEDEGESR
ncbi:MAG: hypothetical protein D3911_14545 [Candidatus Electrothrix sp. AW3_4]|nr:hypothetical protein [Candidatus Electrothrix gigas]